MATVSQRELEGLRRAQLDKSSASIEFLREILELAQHVTAAERAEDEGGPGAPVPPSRPQRRGSDADLR